MKSLKIIVCGKGGCGKSVIAALIAKSLSKKGKNVIVVDSDESNFGLHRKLGMHRPKDLIAFLGGRQFVRNALSGKEKFENVFGKENLERLLKNTSSTKENIKLLYIGKIDEFAEGCACLMNILAKEFIRRLKSDFVVIDTDAGLEHFGRGLEEVCDLVVIVIEPTHESIELANKMKELSKKIGKKVLIVANKVDDEFSKLIKADFYIPFKKEIFYACFKGEEIPLFPEGDNLTELILKMQQ